MFRVDWSIDDEDGYGLVASDEFHSTDEIIAQIMRWKMQGKTVSMATYRRSEDGKQWELIPCD